MPFKAKENMKVLILYNKLFHYRIPVWNLLAKRCDLTVAYSEGDDRATKDVHCDFKIMHLPYKIYGGRFVIQTDNIRKLTDNYDVIVAYGDISWLKYCTLRWFNKKKKVVFHTLGVSADYNKGYDQKKGWDRIRSFFYKRASALAFYTDYPIKKYEKFGIPKERMFVAPNTVYVEPIEREIKKDSILMIGTLYKEKGLQILLDAYLKLKDLDSLPPLYIVGSGPDYEVIKEWIKKNEMEDIIHLEGPVYEVSKKSKYFAKALACISPKQAGLTVLESMGYGVPFITSRNAITGGEVFNVHNDIDGIIYDNDDDLLKIIKNIAECPDKFIEMGRKAKQYYDNNRTIEHMADGLWNAIQYAYEH